MAARRATSPEQPDLFDVGPSNTARAGPLGESSEAGKTSAEAPDPQRLADADLLSAFAAAPLAHVRALGAEIQRRAPKGWEAAAYALWRRFVGFGVTSPCTEQVVVLELVAAMRARDLLAELIACAPVSPALAEAILRAAGTCRSPIPAEMARLGLASMDVELRAAAARIALMSGVADEDLIPFLSDPARVVRRQAAIALGEAGEAAGEPPRTLFLSRESSKGHLVP